MTAQLDIRLDEPAPDPVRWPDLATARPASARAGVARAIVSRAVRRLPIQVTFPDGRRWGRGDADAPEMKLIRPDEVFARIGNDVKIGVGEAYMAGDWTTGDDTDLADLLEPFAARMAHLVPKPLQALRGVVEERLPAHEENTRNGALRNISRHYDLSNDLFAQFLDHSMTYSSAWFPDHVADLDALDLQAAQERKTDGMLDYAGVGDGTTLLEIGTGWGALAIRAAQRGARVTSITISREQAAYAIERVAAAGLEDLVEVRLCDYRDVEGTFDAVVSVEMIEAVGEKFWPTYFATIDRLLAPGGKVAIQAITMGHDRMRATRRSYGWIHKYIFPGGLIPSLQAIEETLADHTRLRVVERRDLGWHYGQTLRLWRERFVAAWPEIEQRGFDATFRRMWEFYLAYCEAGFRTNYLGVSQLQIARLPA
ncbi:MAG: cyclopropane-fatty-acyl-phospholipid synthase family protein [Actinomycetota bacterium]|nr:cyclopropane-fatty-acyl-phospholipid synthase family protein [Actinomycetota bacterium]